jgi:hypothetical protein
MGFDFYIKFCSFRIISSECFFLAVCLVFWFLFDESQSNCQFHLIFFTPHFRFQISGFNDNLLFSYPHSFGSFAVYSLGLFLNLCLSPSVCLYLPPLSLLLYFSISFSSNVICKWIYPFDIGVDLWTNSLNHVQNIFVGMKNKKGERKTGKWSIQTWKWNERKERIEVKTSLFSKSCHCSISLTFQSCYLWWSYWKKIHRLSVSSFWSICSKDLFYQKLLKYIFGPYIFHKS